MCTKQDVSGWFDKGIGQCATHMIVVYKHQHGCRPIYAFSRREAYEQAVALGYGPGDLRTSKDGQDVEAVYDLRMDKEKQLNGSQSGEQVFNF